MIPPLNFPVVRKGTVLFALLLLGMLNACQIERSTTSQTSLNLPEIGELNDTLFSMDPADSLGLDYHKFFVDSQLIALIDTAMTSNFDLKKAYQRMRMAEADQLERSAVLRPMVQGTFNLGARKYGNYTEEGVGNFSTDNVTGNRVIPYPVTPSSFAGLAASWELDIWKKLKAMNEATRYAYLASEEGQKALKTVIVSRISMLYFQLLMHDYELEVINKNINIQQVGLDIISIQKDAGRVTQLAVQQFKAQLLSTKSFLEVMQQRITETENEINLLLGRYPRPIPRSKSIMLAELPEIAKVGVNSQILLQRPDLKVLEMQLKQSDEQIYAARAAFYPALTIGGSAGFESFRPYLLLDPVSAGFNIVGGLAAPLFNRRVLKANLSRQEAQNLELLYDYQQQGIQAYNEVVNNLRGIDRYEKVLELKKQQVYTLNAAVQTSNDLFIVGYATYLEVVTAQERVFQAELELAEVRHEQFRYAIQLYRALGGGWK